MYLLAELGDGSLIRAVFMLAVGVLIGWFVPTPPALLRIVGKKG